jgi:hypothetical protein
MSSAKEGRMDNGHDRRSPLAEGQVVSPGGYPVLAAWRHAWPRIRWSFGVRMGRGGGSSSPSIAGGKIR